MLSISTSSSAVQNVDGTSYPKAMRVSFTAWTYVVEGKAT